MMMMISWYLNLLRGI